MRQDARNASKYFDEYACEYAMNHKLTHSEIIWALLDAVKNIQERYAEEQEEIKTAIPF